MVVNTANTATKVKVFKRNTLFRDTWMAAAKLYWFLLLNGIATVIILYGLSLIIKVG